MLNHIWQIFTYELARNVRRKGYLVMTFGIPLIGLVILLGVKILQDRAAENPDVSQPQEDDFTIQGIQHVGYVDFSGLFSDVPDEDVYTRYETEEAARAALDAGDIDGYYLIPADYLETGDVTLNVPTMAFSVVANSGDLIERLVFDELGGDIDPALINRLRSPTTNVIEVDVSRASNDGAGVERDFGADFSVVYIFALALMLGVFTTNGYLLQSVIDEKENRLIEILVSTVRPISLLTGKILAMGLLGLIQIVVWVGSLAGLVALAGYLGMTGTIFNSLSIPWNLMPVLLAYFVLAYLYFAAAYGAVGALSNSMQEGPQYAVVFTLPAALPLYFLSLFLSAPNDPVPTFLSILPLTAPIAMVQRLVMTNVPAWQIMLSLGLLALTDLVMIWAASKLFRVQSLLAGQVPKLKDIPALLRG